jgi:hypothetical protein
MRIRNTGASPDFSRIFLIDIIFRETPLPKPRIFFKLFSVPVAGLEFCEIVPFPNPELFQNYEMVPFPNPNYLRNVGYFQARKFADT